MLAEIPGDLGVLLWHTTRDLALWAEAPRDGRGSLFADGSVLRDKVRGARRRWPCSFASYASSAHTPRVRRPLVPGSLPPHAALQSRHFSKRHDRRNVRLRVLGRSSLRHRNRGGLDAPQSIGYVFRGRPVPVRL